MQQQLRSEPLREEFSQALPLKHHLPPAPGPSLFPLPGPGLYYFQLRKRGEEVEGRGAQGRQSDAT
jgi:hypothetical protein